MSDELALPVRPPEQWYEAVTVHGEWVEVRVRTPDGEVVVYRVPRRSLFDSARESLRTRVRPAKPALQPRNGSYDRGQRLRDLARPAF